MEFSSKLLQSAVDEVAQLPGIGRRTALRLVLHLMRQPESQTLHLTDALQKMRQNINFCKNCHNISDSELCEICVNTNRQQDVVCVVEDIRDVWLLKALHHLEAFIMCWVGKYLPWMALGLMI